MPSATTPTAWGAGVALLARRDLSEGEVRTRLHRKGHSEGEIEEAVSRLRARGYLDDRALARNCARTKRHGPLRSAAVLQRRQIPEELAAWAIREEFAGGVEVERAREALARLQRKAAAETPERERQRLYRGLIARGFSPEAAREALFGSEEETP